MSLRNSCRPATNIVLEVRRIVGGQLQLHTLLPHTHTLLIKMISREGRDKEVVGRSLNHWWSLLQPQRHMMTHLKWKDGKVRSFTALFLSSAEKSVPIELGAVQTASHKR